MDLSPMKLVELINDSKHTKGVEASININNDNELTYLDNLVFELKKNNLILQIHGDINIPLDKQIEYIKKLEAYSDYLNKAIIMTLHTIYDEDKDVSINKTVEYISNLLKNINNEKIIISLENLNDSKILDRLNKEDIKTTVLNDEQLFFTYDIGHEIADYGQITNLDKYMIDDIRNVHIHSHNRGIDHLPIYKNDIHWNEILKGLIFLINNNYKYNIVFEYALEYCNGNTTEERVKDYLYSIDYVSERIIDK